MDIEFILRFIADVVIPFCIMNFVFWILVTTYNNTLDIEEKIDKKNKDDFMNNIDKLSDDIATSIELARSNPVTNENPFDKESCKEIWSERIYENFFE